MNTKKLYIETIGCQMNTYDSEQFVKCLWPLGYRLTPFLDGADLVIVNTCTIREKAQEKAFSLLGRLAVLKRKNPHLILGVGGCMAQQEGAGILKRMPHLDFVFGTRAKGRLSKIIEKIESERHPIVDIGTFEHIDDVESISNMPPLGVNQTATRFVTIMRGCDNRCAYCVVPDVRGPEVSRDPRHILREIRHLVQSGVREVALLGQNVNSFGKKEGACSFPELLSKIDEIDPLVRIRFTTSHPKGLSTALIESFKDLRKLCKHIHLPVQSGSDRILKKMNRKYTRKDYLDKVKRLRDVCPDIAITTDIIVGFPGERADDFDATLDLIKTVEYDNLFAFKYSDRPDTAAVKLPDKVPEQVKKERLQAVLNLAKAYSKKKNSRLIGSTELVLAEGFSKKQRKGEASGKDQVLQWSGRTSSNKIVNFVPSNGTHADREISIGQMVRVRIETAYTHSLFGTLVKEKRADFWLKGEDSYAT